MNHPSNDRDPSNAASPEVGGGGVAGEPVLLVPPASTALRSRQSPAIGTRSLRAGALLIALLPFGLFAVASRLEPNSSGLGTHQQLGLPPCSMRAIFGIRCPGCGMTTSWAHFTRGQWRQSFLVNVGGFLLACFSLFIAGLAVRAFWLVQLPSLQTQRVIAMVCIGIMAVTFLDWIRRLAT